MARSKSSKETHCDVLLELLADDTAAAPVMAPTVVGVGGVGDTGVVGDTDGGIWMDMDDEDGELALLALPLPPPSRLLLLPRE